MSLLFFVVSAVVCFVLFSHRWCIVPPPISPPTVLLPVARQPQPTGLHGSHLVVMPTAFFQDATSALGFDTVRKSCLRLTHYN